MEDNGKAAGIVSYFSIIGWLIAYFGMYQNKKTSLASYQLRQTLLFHIVSIVLYYGLTIVFSIVFIAGSPFFFLYNIIRLVELGLFVLWVIGLIGAIQGEEKAIPLIGDRAQTMFPNI